MKLLDTCVCISIFRGKEPASSWFRQQDTSALALCSIVLAELFVGARKSKAVSDNMASILAFSSRLQSLPFDDRAADQYGYLRASLESTGQMIGSQDAMIAAIALAHNIPVVTENVREFIRVPGLKIESIRSVI